MLHIKIHMGINVEKFVNVNVNESAQENENIRILMAFQNITSYFPKLKLLEN